MARSRQACNLVVHCNLERPGTFSCRWRQMTPCLVGSVEMGSVYLGSEELCCPPFGLALEAFAHIKIEMQI